MGVNEQVNNGKYTRHEPKCSECMDDFFLHDFGIKVKNGHMNKGEMAAGKYSCPMEHLGYTLK